MLTMYGIPNCDQVKRAKNWLDSNRLTYDFFDFKKKSLNLALLKDWLTALGHAKLINRRSTTWRQLSEEQKNCLNNLDSKPDSKTLNAGLQLLIDNPTLIKRPILVNQNHIQAGFDESAYKSLLK